MHRQLMIVAAMILWGSPMSASARTVRVEIMRAQVKCVTVTRNGALETTCSIKGLQRVKPREIPAPAGNGEIPSGDRVEIPPPLTEDDLSPSGELPGDVTRKHPPRKVKVPPCGQVPVAPPTPRDPTPLTDHDLPKTEPPAPPAQAAPRARKRAPAPRAPAPRNNPPVVSTPPAPAPATRPRRTVRLYSGEVQVLALLNKERVRQGMSPLSLDARAIEAARAHSKDMCDRGYFDHTSPEGKHPWDRLRAAGASFGAAAENIARGYLTARSVHDGWTNSPGHRRNRLNPVYTRVGVGLHMCRGKVPYWTELFMK